MMWQSKFQNRTSSINLWKYAPPQNHMDYQNFVTKANDKNPLHATEKSVCTSHNTEMWNSMSRWITSLPTDYKYGNYILFFCRPLPPPRLCLTTFRHHKSVAVPLCLWNNKKKCCFDCVGLTVWHFYSLNFTYMYTKNYDLQCHSVSLLSKILSYHKIQCIS